VRIEEVQAGSGVPAEIEGLARASYALDGDDAPRLPAMVWFDAPGAWRARLIAYDEARIAGVLLGSVVGTIAYIDLLLVAPHLRRRGLGSELIAKWEERADKLGAQTFSIGANLHAYAWPGVDIRYTAAIATFLHVGYLRQNVLFNMDVDLPVLTIPSASELGQLDVAGIAVRRGRPEDSEALAAHNAKYWSTVWARETQAALHRPKPTIFLGLAKGEIVGFAAHGVLRASNFGPLGTAPEWRRVGLGGILTRLALADVAADGHRLGEIAWVNESAIPFYSRCSNARLGRTFWTMTRKATATAS